MYSDNQHEREGTKYKRSYETSIACSQFFYSFYFLFLTDAGEQTAYRLLAQTPDADSQ